MLQRSRALIWQTGSRALAAAPWLVQSISSRSAEAFDARPSSSRWAWAAAACAAAGVATAAAAASQHEALADAYDEPRRSAEQLRLDFMAWIKQNGGHMDGVALAPSKQDPSAGLGLVSTPELRRSMRQRWLGRRLGALVTGQATLAAAEVPLDLALTAAAARRDPELGSSYTELMDLGLADERTAVVLMLLVERMRGGGSRYAPWMRLLPDSFSTPLWFDEEQLRELRGTALAAAAATHMRLLRAQWERLRPAMVQMLRQVGCAQEPEFEDFAWAYSAFWSRGQSLPVPERDGGSDGGDGGGGGEEGGAGGGGGGVLRVTVTEGVVPGLDFANHSMQASCWWEVSEPGEPPAAAEAAGAEGAAAAGASGSYVRLVTNRACLPKAGSELTISYGDKSNEELLMLYGFASPGNPHDQLMLACPLPPQQKWGPDTIARLELLRARGLRPQLFLEAARLPGLADGAPGREHRSVLGGAARRVLGAFVMPAADVAARLERLERGEAEEEGDDATAAGRGGRAPFEGESRRAALAAAGDSISARARAEALGEEMALLTTLVRLLELKVLELEGAERGTGPLEADEARLAAAEAARARGGAGGGGGGGGGGELAPWLQSVLAYRAGQKALARGYLAAARRELQETLRALTAAAEAEEGEGAAGGGAAA